METKTLLLAAQQATAVLVVVHGLAVVDKPSAAAERAPPALPQGALGRISPAKLGDTQEVRNVLFSRDGAVLVAVCQDGFIRVFEVATGKQLYQLSQADRYWACWSVSFSPHAKLVAAGGADSVCFW